MLTVEDITAFKIADDIHVHTHKGRSWVVAELRDHGGKENPRIYTAREQRLFPIVGEYLGGRCREITTEEARLIDYGTGRSGDYSAFVGWFGRDLWFTACESMRPGHTLTFEWCVNNNNDNLLGVAYVRDEFKLIVQGEFRSVRGGTRKVTRTFLMSVSVGPDNSARMVQRKP